MEDLKNIKEELFQERMKIEVENKTRPWELLDLEKVLKSLKKNKARDPHGLSNEIFRPRVAGKEFKTALLKLLNMMKRKTKVPMKVKWANVTLIYKGKGEKTDMNNDRGVFNLTIFRTILDKLIYNDEYKNIDESMSDSNVGARKSRNIRDNLFVINGIINSVVQK